SGTLRLPTVRIRGMVVILWLPRITGDQLCGKYLHGLLSLTEGTEILHIKRNRHKGDGCHSLAGKQLTGATQKGYTDNTQKFSRVD
ncbi:MAG: hypothetical protein J4G18_05190, partial [Anaerolineae bacterium]|nr:hypothetical protein [Anaerolineae bacterium]